jgi:putative FmdB family regulatory protein
VTRPIGDTALPLYEYQCKKCHSLTERIQKFSDEPLTVCPHCGGELEQLLSAPAVQFKGSGWYATDYAKKEGRAGSSSGNGSAPTPSSEGKAETPKTETKGASPSTDTSSKER